MKLSITMMVKNESKHLDKCLNSLLTIMNEIDSELIIVDTGSEDNTIEIAKKYTDNVYRHEWNGNFAEMRNISIGYAKGEWIFVIDGDEVIDNPIQLVCFLNSVDSDNYNTGVVAIKSFLSGDNESSYEVHLNARLFKKLEDFKYEGAVHEQPKIELPVLNIGVQLLHYGYISTDKELMEKKFDRNVRILKAELEKNQDNIYYWFQLAQSYGMHKDYKESLDACIKAYKLVKKKKADKNRYKYIYNFLVYVYYWNNKYEKVVKSCKETLKIRDGNIDIYYFLGHAQMKLSNVREAIESFQMYLKYHQEYDKSYIDFMEPIYTLGYVEEIYLGLSILYKELKQYNQAIKYVDLIESDTFLIRSIPAIIDLYIKTKKYEELKKYYDRKILGKKEDLSTQFIVYLESIIKSLDKIEKSELSKVFAGKHNNYSILNSVRLEELYNNPIDSKILKCIESFQLNTLPEFYGDVIYYLIKREVAIKDVFPNLKEMKLHSHLVYLSNKDDISSIILRYLKKHRNTVKINDLRINKTLAKYALIQNQVKEDDYRYILSIYIEDGTRYIEEIYDSKVIQNEMIYDLKDDEDIFLLYMYYAEKVKYSDMIQHIRYLRKALKAYPLMNEVIKILLNEARELVNENRPTESFDSTSHNETIKNNVVIDESAQLMQYKNQIKSQIEDFINNSKLQEAKELIHEYEKLVPKDIEILCMKGIIAMMEQDLEFAQVFFEQGLEADSNNFDILYNLAYLFKIQNEDSKALFMYQKALPLAEEVEIRDQIRQEINELSESIDGQANISRQDIKEDNIIGNEFEHYKRNIKEKIMELIDEMKVEDAMNIIAEYEKIVPNDLEILLFKSQIAVCEI